MEAKDIAAKLVAQGYRRVSNRHRVIARIDRPDWKEVLCANLRKSIADLYIIERTAAAPGYRIGDEVSPIWADHYRRCFSRDSQEVLVEVFRLIPASDWDATEYVTKEGEGA